MAKVVGDIAVKVGADVGPLQRNMKKAGQSVDDFDTRAKAMAVNVAKAGAAIAVAMVGATTAILAMGREAAAVGVEIKNLSAIAGVGTTDFQKYAAASRSVGIEQEKLADIFKDVNDKFGDFQATGAGPLADFFEQIAPKIGVTADMFAKLSGPEALQLYVSSLEKAGVSQQQMTFYMEALASDATALIPLLQNNGQAMRNLGNAAYDAGRILDEQMIAAAAELDQELRDLSDTIKMNATKAVLEHKEEIILLADFITETLIPAVSSLAGVLGTVALGWKTIAEEARNAIEPITRALNLSAQSPGATESGNIIPSAPGGFGPDAGDTSATGTGYIDDNGNWVEYGTGSAASGSVIPGITAPSLPMTTGTALDPTGGLLPEKTPLDLAREAWEAQQELNEEIEDGTRQHTEDIVEIERRAAEERARLEKQLRDEKFASVAGMFGDLSSLMQSENEKLFKIGKAAAIAEATVSGISSAISAWEKGMSIGGPPLAAAFAGASIVKTGALISQLSSASQGGGARPSIGGGSTPTAQQPGAASGGGGAADQAQRASVNLTLIGEQGFTRAQVVQVAEALNEAGGDGTRLVDIRGRR